MEHDHHPTKSEYTNRTFTAGIILNLAYVVVLTIAGVENLHHLHIWAISTKENAMSGHLVVSENLAAEQPRRIKNMVKLELKGLKIEHCTLEIETLDHSCEDEKC